MASLHKDPRGRSPFFYAAFLLPNGKRTFRSTRQRDRRKAQDVARAWEKASDAARQGVLMEAQARMKDRVALTTVRMDLKIVRGILSSARRQGLILHNPGEAVELPLAAMRGRDVFTAEQVRRLLDAAPPDWRTAILLAFYTGQR